MSVFDRVRAAGWRALSGNGAVASQARALNERLGRPLASPEELADRKAFAAGYTAKSAAATATPAPETREAAPVIIYYLDKQKRDVPRLTEILDGQHIPYKTMSLEEDPAALAAVRRDSGGYRLPVVFIAGDCVGGKVELVNLVASGALKKKVYG